MALKIPHLLDDFPIEKCRIQKWHSIAMFDSWRVPSSSMLWESPRKSHSTGRPTGHQLKTGQFRDEDRYVFLFDRSPFARQLSCVFLHGFFLSARVGSIKRNLETKAKVSRERASQWFFRAIWGSRIAIYSNMKHTSDLFVVYIYIIIIIVLDQIGSMFWGGHRYWAIILGWDSWSFITSLWDRHAMGLVHVPCENVSRLQRRGSDHLDHTWCWYLSVYTQPSYERIHITRCYLGPHHGWCHDRENSPTMASLSPCVPIEKSCCHFPVRSGVYGV